MTRKSPAISTTDEVAMGPLHDDGWSERFAASVKQHRRRARDLLQAHRERLQRTEAALDSQVLRLAAELTDDRKEADIRERDVTARAESLHREAELLQEQTEHLARLKAELALAQSQWQEARAEFVQQQQELYATLDTQQQQLEGRRSELDAMAGDLDSREETLDNRQADIQHQEMELVNRGERLDDQQRELDERAAQLSQLKETLDGAAGERQQDEAHLECGRRELTREQAKLELQREKLTHEIDRTKNQRRTIAQQLRARHAELLADVERRRAEFLEVASGEESALHRELAQAAVQADRLQQEVTQHENRCAELTAQIEELRTQVAARDEEVDQLRGQACDLTAQVEEQAGQGKVEIAEELDNLRRQRDELADKLDRAQEAAQQLPAASESEEVTDLRGRLEMAIGEVRELRSANECLQKELEDRPPAKSQTSVVAGGGLDWEAQKQRMLAQLESGHDDNDQQQRAERLKVEDAIRATEEALATKDNEVEQLKRQLAEQQESPVASDGPDPAELLDEDELVREERERLKLMQDEWREKLRIAEVDISVERAKLARDRVELEEKLAALESEIRRGQSQPADANDGSKRNRGRWLARLGLQDSDE